jgi:5'-nucleotidase
MGADIANIVSRLDNAVDLVISGHTHAAYNCSASTVAVAAQLDASGKALKDSKGNTLTTVTPRPSGLPNATGRLVPVTSASAFGRVLSDIDVTLDPTTRDITAVSVANRLVDRNDASVTPDAVVSGIVNGYNALVSPIANQVIGSVTAAMANSSDAAGNMPAGELIADSQLLATRPAGFGNAVIAFMNAGGVRAPGFTYASSPAGEGDGNVTYGEAFTVQPFGNSLVTLTLTSQDLKNALEQQFVGCRGQGTQRILIPSSGLKYSWDASGTCDARIKNLRLVDTATGAVTDQIVDASGVVLDPLKTYRVTINNFLSTGGDGFTAFLNGKDLLGGAQDIDALVAYLANYKSPANPAYDPSAAVLQKPRITRVMAP